MKKDNLDPKIMSKAVKFINSLQGQSYEEVVCILSAVISTLCVCEDTVLDSEAMALAIYNKISGKDLSED